MVRLGALVLVCMLEHVAFAAPAWSITWPAGWADVTQEVLKQPGMQAKLEQLGGQHATTEIAARANGEGHVVQVVYTELPLEGRDTSTSAMVRGFERGARNAARANARELSYAQREVGDTLVAEQTLGLDGATIHVKWIAGAGHERMRGVQASCNAPQALCATVLASLALDPSTLEPLTTGGRRILRVVATLASTLIGALIGWWLLSRLRRRRGPAG